GRHSAHERNGFESFAIEARLGRRGRARLRDVFETSGNWQRWLQIMNTLFPLVFIERVVLNDFARECTFGELQRFLAVFGFKDLLGLEGYAHIAGCLRKTLPGQKAEK